MITVDNFFLIQRTFFFLLMKYNGFILLDFLFFQDMDLIFHLLLEHKRNKTYKRCTANSSGTKFNMKHSLKSLDLQRSRRSLTEQPTAEDHTDSLHQHHPLQHFSFIQQLSPCPATRFPQNGFTLGSAALSHTALCTIFQTVIKYVTTHKFKPFLNNDTVSISPARNMSGMP